MRYSALALAWNAITGNRKWTPVWREAAPRPEYDVLVIGGGGHGLATAYYLAKEHGISDVAVLEKSWIGSGNVAGSKGKAFVDRGLSEHLLADD